MRFTGFNGSRGGGCAGCCGPPRPQPCSCGTCDIPATNLTVTVVGDPGCLSSCNMPDQTVTLTFSGTCSTKQWVGTLEGTFDGAPNTLYLLVNCTTGAFNLSISFSPTYSPTICTGGGAFGGLLTFANANSYTCDPFMVEWVAPVLSFGDYVCGCCIKSLTLTP